MWQPAQAAEELSGKSLHAQYVQLRPELADSPFDPPLILNSKVNNSEAHGQVFAILDFPLAQLSHNLIQPEKWCEIALLHVNVKACTYQPDKLHFYVGRKYYQTPAEAYPLSYRFEALSDDGMYLHVRLSAPDGPLGTSDYLINVEAIPIEGHRSFLRFQYSYRYGMMARLALSTYLATLGRNKVGFTVVNTDDQGETVYVQGIEGVVERNVMRYLIAIQSFLEAEPTPPQLRFMAQITRWFAHASKYPRQLIEFTRSDYLDAKKKELLNQQILQQQLRTEQ